MTTCLATPHNDRDESMPDLGPGPVDDHNTDNKGKNNESIMSSILISILLTAQSITDLD